MIFEVLPEDIEALNDTDLRRLIGLLCEQEVIRSGQSPVGVTYGGNQTAKDGGTDVRVNVVSPLDVFIPRPQAIFQSKAEDMPAGKITEEMKPKGVLRDSIRELGKQNGAYIIVSSKGSTADPALTNRRNAMAAAIADVPEAAGLQVDFYDRQRMATWVNQHPGLVPWVRTAIGKPLSGWKAFEDWSSSPEPLDQPYLLDGDVRLVDLRTKDEGLGMADGINRLRGILAKPKGVVRLVGLSGVGKTRLVQALFDDRVGENSLPSTIAVYADRGDDLSPTPQELLVRLQDLNQRCILIVDNCGTELHQKLSARIAVAGGQVSLVTVEYDITDDEPSNTSVFRLEPASAKIIEQIVERRFPNLTGPEVSTIAAFSEGNSRVALALASTAEDGESLANLNDTQLFQRLFKQKKEENPALLKAAQVLSLVYSFDGETLDGEVAELPSLAKLAGQSVDDLYGHVAELQRRQLVQKRGKWRAVLPHALAHRLAKTALENIPAAKIDAAFRDVSAPERLQRSFTRRIGYLHDSETAKKLVSGWVAPNGWLSDLENFNDFGMQAFENVAPVDPDRALEAIEQAGQRNNSFFSDANDNRDDFVRLLRALAYDPDEFDRAIRLIGSFIGAAEPSNNVGNATSVYSSLFHLYLSGTHASPEQRTLATRRCIESDEPHDQALGKLALGGMLEDHFTSSYSFDFGTRKRDYGYFPKTRAEERAWYAGIVKMCRDIGIKGSKYRPYMKEVLADSMAELAQTLGASAEIVDLVTDFASDGWPEGWAGARKALRKFKTAKVEDPEIQEKLKVTAQKLEELAKLLEPKNMEEQIAAYVLPESYTVRDLGDVDDEDDATAAFHKAQEQVNEVCREIGRQLAENRDQLKKVLPLLMSAKAHRIVELGNALGESSTDPKTLWDDLVDQATMSGTDASLHLLSCVMHGIAKKNREIAEELLDQAIDVERLHPQLVHLNCMLSLNERSVKRLLQAAKLPTVPSFAFTTLGHGRSHEPLTGAQFRRVLLAVATREGGLEVAFDVMNMRIHTAKSDQKRELGKVEKRLGTQLLARVRFGKKQTLGRTREDGDVGTVAKACLVAPDDEALARDLCEKLLEAIGTYQTSPMDHSKLVQSLATKFPHVVLDVLVEKGQTGGESRRSMFSGFRDRAPDPLGAISDDVILGWAHQKPETRFQHLAEAVRPWSRKPDEAPTGWTSATLRLIREAPKPTQVLDTLYGRLRPSSWSSLTESLSQRLPLLEVLVNDSNPEIADWAEKAVVKFKAYIERVRIDEAKDQSERDERFE